MHDHPWKTWIAIFLLIFAFVLCSAAAAYHVFKTEKALAQETEVERRVIDLTCLVCSSNQIKDSLCYRTCGTTFGLNFGGDEILLTAIADAPTLTKHPLNSLAGKAGDKKVYTLSVGRTEKHGSFEKAFTALLPSNWADVGKLEIVGAWDKKQMQEIPLEDVLKKIEAQLPAEAMIYTSENMDSSDPFADLKNWGAAKVEAVPLGKMKQ